MLYSLIWVAAFIDSGFFLSSLFQLFVKEAGLISLLFLSGSGALSLFWWLIEFPREEKEVKYRTLLDVWNKKNKKNENK